jgi:hypothetical protein
MVQNTQILYLIFIFILPIVYLTTNISLAPELFKLPNCVKLISPVILVEL